MAAESPFRNLSWRSVGPKFSGGRIESIDAVPGDPGTIYVGVGSGNVWKTENGGLTWRPIFEHESTFTIGAVAASRSRPGLIWVGSGESLMARSSFAGTGMFKSTDGGRTWRNMGLSDTHHIGRILLDPGNPDVVYAAALGHLYTFNEERGLFKTTDGGATWKKILYVSDKAGVVDAVMDPSDAGILYAAAWERDRKAWRTIGSGPGSGIYKTADGGASWKKLASGLPSGPELGKIGLAVAASNPNVVYAAVDNPAPDPKDPKKKLGWEIYRSADKGESWAKVNREPLPSAFGDLQVSPEDENRLYVLGVDVWASSDGGKTYERMGGTVVHLEPHPTRALHLDQHEAPAARQRRRLVHLPRSRPDLAPCEQPARQRVLRGVCGRRRAVPDIRRNAGQRRPRRSRRPGSRGGDRRRLAQRLDRPLGRRRLLLYGRRPPRSRHHLL
jgi:photosystem II stability/assembly factor-like uncharacterized protein